MAMGVIQAKGINPLRDALKNEN